MTFLFCNFGDEVTNRFIDLNDVFYELDWHIYPIQFRKDFPLLLLASKKPIYLRGLAEFLCTREVFKKVWHFIFVFFFLILDFFLL